MLKDSIKEEKEKYKGMKFVGINNVSELMDKLEAL
jgi:hypothetical protein